MTKITDLSRQRHPSVNPTSEYQRIHDLEQYALDHPTLRGPNLLEAFNDRPVPNAGDKPLWSGNWSGLENFMRRIHQDINEMRILRGALPRAGNGWDALPRKVGKALPSSKSANPADNSTHFLHSFSGRNTFV